MNTRSEWYIYEEIRKIFPRAQHRRLMCLKNRTLEIDVFIENLPVAIEYDGPHHRRRVKKDENKNYLLHQAGIQLIRIREPKLPSLRCFGSIVIGHNPKDPSSLDHCIHQILEEIYFKFSIPEEQLRRFQPG
jgi:hypothetical protein